MSKEQTVNVKEKIHKLPLIIKKESLKSGSSSNYGLLLRCTPNSLGNFIREDVLYKAKDDDFLMGKYPNLLITNSLNVVKNSSRTTATYNAPNLSTIKLTSDAVAATIGQENYDQVFAALCSVISQELKVKGVLALLSAPKKYSTADTQTYESSFNELIRDKQRRRNARSKIKPYVVQDHIKTSPKKVVVYKCDLNLVKSEDIKLEIDEHVDNIHTSPVSDISHNYVVELNKNKTDINSLQIEVDANTASLNTKRREADDLFPDLSDEDSIISNVGSVGNLSVGSDFSLTNVETNAKSILNYIEQHTEEINDLGESQPLLTSTVSMVDGSTVTIRGNPDPFHLATPDVLKDLIVSDQKKIILYQAYIDWKYCLQRDEDDNLPIHSAVFNNDVSLLKRQCLVLKSRNETVDIVAGGNLTALQIAIFQDCPECMAVLLAHGADLLIRDEESRTALHLAAEMGPKHVEALLTHCTNNAREILKDDDDLWRPELESKSDTKLAQYLIMRLNTMCDDQGYTPLMLASKVGNFATTELLARAAPNAVNMAMPTCGNTALYLAVGAACFEATSRGDKTDVPENFRKTIEILVENGADPSIENNSGSNVNILLSEFSIVKLTMLIANKLTAVKYFNGDISKNCDSLMLVKDDKGKINIADMNSKPINRVFTRISSKEQLQFETMDTEDKIIVKYPTDYKTNPVPKQVENIANNIDINETEKPVILNNMSVVTKIVSFGKTNEKPILVRGISPKPGAINKGLKTPITAGSPKQNSQTFIPLVKKFIAKSPPKYLKILPKPDAVDPPKCPMDVTKTTKVAKPKSVPKPKTVTVTNIKVAKKTPLILRTTAVKRPKSDDTASSASKIPKTE